jgi:hypothetical protein
MIIAPVLFLKKIAGIFSRKVSIVFSDFSFLFKIEKNDIPYREYNFELEEIASCSFQLIAQRFVVIKFFLKNGHVAEYSFIIDNGENYQISATEILNEFSDRILSFNKVNYEKKISIRPSFLASNTGLLSIYGLTILIIIAVLVHASKQFKTFPITLFIGIGILIQIIVRRNSEIKFYKKYQDIN